MPIVANWLRAYMIVMLAHLSSNKLATGVDHLVYGWLFFGLVMMLLFWVGNFWRDDDEADLAAPPVDPQRIVATRGATGLRGFAVITAAVIAVAAPWPALGNWLERLADSVYPGEIAIGNVAGWQAGAEPFSSFTPHYVNARSTDKVTFASGDRKVSLFVAYYSGQLTNGPLVTYGNDVVLVSDKVWGSVAQRARSVDLAGAPLAVVENELKGDTTLGNERLLSWNWYWINGRLTTSKYLAKAYNALDKLTGRGDDSAVIVVTTPMDAPTDANAAATLASFVTAAQPQIAARLAAIREQARQ